MPVEFVLSCVIAYLLGSINSAIIYCRLRHLPDPRSQGSKNPGTSNVYRMAGQKAASTVLIFDFIKGLIPTWGAYHLGFLPNEIGAIAIAVCLGHMFPIFFGFQGGKAVATALGCIFPIGFLGLASIAIWVLVFRLTKYSSLSAISTAGLTPIVAHFYYPKYSFACMMLGLFIIARHFPNIVRLFKGQEPKLKNKL